MASQHSPRLWGSQNQTGGSVLWYGMLVGLGRSEFAGRLAERLAVTRGVAGGPDGVASLARRTAPLCRAANRGGRCGPARPCWRRCAGRPWRAGRDPCAWSRPPPRRSRPPPARGSRSCCSRVRRCNAWSTRRGSLARWTMWTSWSPRPTARDSGTCCAAGGIGTTSEEKRTSSPPTSPTASISTPASSTPRGCPHAAPCGLKPSRRSGDADSP